MEFKQQKLIKIFIVLTFYTKRHQYAQAMIFLRLVALLFEVKYFFKTFQ